MAWQERDKALWAGGAALKIELAYDVHCSFLVTAMFQLDKSELVEDGLMRTFTTTLAEHSVREHGSV